MAKTETIVMTCDDCGAVDEVHDVRYAISGINYAIDLCGSCRGIFAALMARYIEHSTRVKFNHHVIRRDEPTTKQKRRGKVAA